MTTPYERMRSVAQTREFLEQLRRDANVPESIRYEAYRLLRHYPSNVDLSLAASALPIWWGPLPENK
jgi:hypothetical protein